MNEAGIKQVVSCAGWLDVIEFIRNTYDLPLETKGLSVEEIGKQYLALQIAKERFDFAISRLQAMVDQEQRENKSYK